MNKQLLVRIGIILLIFSVGLFLRLDAVNLDGYSDAEKSFYQDENGLPYMIELDSYYNYRLTKNLLEHGYMGDAIINGVQWDLHSYYPGVPLDYPPLIAYLTAFIYKFVNLFTEIPLLVVCFWLSAFIAPLAGIIAYLFMGRFTNQYGAVAAGVLTVTIPFYFARTVPGWFDTDMFNLIFPFLVVWFLFELFDNINKSTEKGIYFSIFSGLSLFLFSLAWSGWQYLFYIIIIFWAIHIIWSSFKGENFRNHLYCFSVFLITTIVLVWLFTGFINIIKLLYSPLQLIGLYGASWQDWPNIYISVSELRPPFLEELLSVLGVSIYAGLLGILWIGRILTNESLQNKILPRMNWQSFSFLVFWGFAGIFSLTQGYRFIMLLVPPLIVSTSFMIGISVQYLNILANSGKTLFLRKKPVLTFFAIIILFVTLLPGIINVQMYNYSNPIIDDDYWEAAIWIKNNTTKNTVIVTDWSFGHVYTAIADRSVVQDGRMGYIETLSVHNYDNLYPFKDKSPSTSRNYWISRSFSTDNESFSAGILQMITSTGDQGFIKINRSIKNTTKTVEVMNNILGLQRSDAKELLINHYNFQDHQVEEILELTHPENPSPMVLVTYDDDIVHGFWTFEFGEWNFQERRTNNYTYSVGDVEKKGDLFIFSNDVMWDIKTKNVVWKNKTPYCVGYVKNRSSEKIYMDSNSDFCIFIIDDKKAVVMDKRFENSIFTKLVLEKSNSTIYKPLYANKGVTVWGLK